VAEDSCAKCRHHRKETREVVVREVFDTVVETDDAVFYLCVAPKGPHAGKEVGFVPVLCSSFEPSRVLDTSALDARIAQAEDRLLKRAEKEKGELS
jgi:hypothetical protein